jgi:hypothetical protein
MDEVSLAPKPHRVQLSRRKGWRMPPNTVSVARPGALGNPFTKSAAIESGYANDATWRSFVVECFRDWLAGGRHGRDWWQGPKADAARSVILVRVPELRGKNLACWCPLDAPCHADVLLELANTTPPLASGRAAVGEGGL